MQNALTLSDLKKLRTADRIIFRHLPHVATIEAVETVSKVEGRYDLTVASSVKSFHQEDLPTEAHCCHMLWTNDAGDHAQYWRTIAGILKTGDRLELFWGHNYGSNGELKKANLFHDRLSLYVHRKSKKLTFIIPTPVCGDNTARTIRHGENNEIHHAARFSNGRADRGRASTLQNGDSGNLRD